MRLLAVAIAAVFVCTGTAFANDTIKAKVNNVEPYEKKYANLYADAGNCQERKHAVWKEGDPKREVMDGIKQMKECIAWEPPVIVAPESIAGETITTTDYGSTGTSWDAVASCESSGDWSADTGNGYYGGLQFDEETWDAYGNPAYPQASDAPPAEQIAAAESMPYDGWPNC